MLEYALTSIYIPRGAKRCRLLSSLYVGFYEALITLVILCFYSAKPKTASLRLFSCKIVIREVGEVIGGVWTRQCNVAMSCWGSSWMLLNDFRKE
jgi:hypothetical protein